jgi:hypothetical protein
VIDLALASMCPPDGREMTHVNGALAAVAPQLGCGRSPRLLTYPVVIQTL